MRHAEQAVSALRISAPIVMINKDHPAQPEGEVSRVRPRSPRLLGAARLTAAERMGALNHGRMRYHRVSADAHSTAPCAPCDGPVQRLYMNDMRETHEQQAVCWRAARPAPQQLSHE
jgi:hypothetical protein